MITINVLLKVKAEKEQDYLAFLDDMVQKSRQDDGCLFYDHFRNVKHHNESFKNIFRENPCLLGGGNCTKNQPQLRKIFNIEKSPLWYKHRGDLF